MPRSTCERSWASSTGKKGARERGIVAADLLILNGRVWTGDPANPRAQAVAVKGDRVVAVGTEVVARDAVSRAAAVLDASGRPILPGLIDAYNHDRATADALPYVNVRFPAVTSR